MANCHFKQETQHVPTAVITGLDINNGGILINNHYPTDHTIGTWAVVGARVMITRFWSASSATVMITPNMPTLNTTPRVLPVGISLEEEFSIWMGYIESPRPVTIEDLKEGRLLRTFTGVIENLKDTQTTKGVSLMIQARDRAKWFLDSSIWFSAREIIASAGTSRADLILDIANRAIGSALVNDVYTSLLTQKDKQGNEVKGKTILKPTDAQYFTSPETDTDTTTQQANLWYVGTTDTPGPLGAKLKSLEAIAPNPEFRIRTTRLNIVGSTQADEETRNAIHYLLAGNQPMEVLKGLSMQEIYPMEIFQSQYDGNFYYAPRGNDSTGLTDPERFNRRYFFKPTLSGLDVNQRLIALRTEESSVGLKTNFIVSKQAPNTQETYDDYILHLMTQPAALRGKSYALKLHKVYDPTIQTATDAALIAIALARVWAKEVEAGLAVMLGDPSIVPGEILQLYGDINSARAYQEWLGSNEGKTLNDFLQNEITQFNEYDAQWNTNLIDLIKIAKENSNATSGTTDPRIVASTIVGVNLGGNTELVPGAGLESGENSTNGDPLNNIYNIANVGQLKTGEELGFADVPKTIYRVEAIIHKYNMGSKGYTSELALISPF
jgi:hypothetical protein